MKRIATILIIALISACTEGENIQELRNNELTGKVYHFTTEFDSKSCNILPNSAVCYNSTYIGFLDENQFVQASKCGGYDLTYTGTYEFRDSLILNYKKSVLNEYFVNASDSLVKRVAAQDETMPSRRYFLPDTCGTVAYFIDPDVAEYGFSQNTATHPDLYGVLDKKMTLEQLIQRMKICGEWNDL